MGMERLSRDRVGAMCGSLDAEVGEPAGPEPVESEASRRRGLMVVETAMELAGTGRRAA